jgi:Bacterial capsule synthesis protein PGA_cap
MEAVELRALSGVLLAGAAVVLAAAGAAARPPPAADQPRADGTGPAPGPAAGVGTIPVTTASAAPRRPPPTTAPPDRRSHPTHPTRPARSFTLVATGDVLLHPPLWAQARADAAAAGRPGHEFRPLLAGVRPLVAGADLALYHLETPLAPPGGPDHGYPAFSVPPEIAPALAATGYDACSTASNHTYDQGAAGVDRTLDALDAAGLRHAGSARTPAEAASITLLRAGPARVAYLAYTYGFNGIPAPGGQEWRANRIDRGRILSDAARARAAGADVVVVAVHWGTENQAEPDAQQRALAPVLIRSPDVDLVLGHHAHVVEPIEWAGGEWVVYGLGNEVATQSASRHPNQEGLLVRFTFREGPAGWHAARAEYAPLLLDRTEPLRLVDVGAALARPGTPGPSVARLREAWARTTAVVGRRGGPAHGLRPIAPAP